MRSHCCGAGLAPPVNGMSNTAGAAAPVNPATHVRNTVNGLEVYLYNVRCIHLRAIVLKTP